MATAQQSFEFTNLGLALLSVAARLDFAEKHLSTNPAFAEAVREIQKSMGN